MNAELLLAHFDRIADAPDAVPRLRRFIRDLAVRGKLVPQNANDEAASELVKRIAAEKGRLVRAGEIRKPRDLDDGEAITVPFEIPQSWRWVRLDSVGAIVGGGTPSANESVNFAEPGQGIPWLTPADLGRYSELYVSRGSRDLTEKGLQSSSATLMPGGTVLFTSRAPIGYLAIAANPLSTNQGFKSIVPYVPDCSRFIALAMQCFAPEIDAKAPGTTFREVSGKIVAGVPFPLPPLAEQHRIVAKVDELMALCDRLEAAQTERETTRTRLAAASLARLNAPGPDPAVFRKDAAFALDNLTPLANHLDQIIALRQTILNLAVRGKLVPQYPTDEPVSALLKRMHSKGIQLVESRKMCKPKPGYLMDEPPFDIPSSWKWMGLGEIAQFENGDRSKNYPSGSDIMRAGVPFFSTKNVSDYTVKFDQLEFITEEKFQSLRSGKARDLDILITLRGSVGKLGLFRATEKFTTGFINAQLLIVRIFDPDSVCFCVTFMKSQAFMNQISSKSSGSTTPQLSATQLAEVMIPLPPLAEQRRIVARVGELMTLCDRLEATLSACDETQWRLVESALHETLEHLGN